MSESQMVHLRIRGEDGKMHPITYFHGDKGDKGDKGDPGENGADGVSITSTSINPAGELLLSLSNGTVINVGNIKGPKGDQGEPGATGPKGNVIKVMASVPTSTEGYDEGDLILVLK